MTDLELAALHRELIAIPSPSHEEAAICAHVEGWLRGRGLAVERLGDNVLAAAGAGPTLCLCTHLDTVPASSGWTREPCAPVVEEGRVYGLGSNDAKASVAAMLAAFARLAALGDALKVRVLLALVCEEETGGRGAQLVVPELARRGELPAAVVVGEPTYLDVAIAQKGLLVLELREQGRACHAAHGRMLRAPNALRRLARDLTALEAADLGAPHPELGPVTIEPTVATGGTARNMVPAEASCFLDVRTNPPGEHAALVERLGAGLDGELRVADELRPYEIDAGHPLVRAATTVRPQARLFGSRGLSDLVYFAAEGVAAIKVGPGVSERSHTPDEFVLESEVLEGARFYEELVLAYGAGSQA